jgi:hypothetical protein
MLSSDFAKESSINAHPSGMGVIYCFFLPVTCRYLIGEAMRDKHCLVICCNRHHQVREEYWYCPIMS